MSVPTAEHEYDEAAAVGLPSQDSSTWREWIMVAVGLTALIAIIAAAVSLVAFATNDKTETKVVARETTTKAVAPTAAVAAAPKLADAKGIKFEPFKAVDPTLPQVPAGTVKKFTVDVEQHVVQVAPDLAPTRPR